MGKTLWKIVYRWIPFVALCFGCDSTIHEYPAVQSQQVIIELNVDRTPPLFYKRLEYDENGNYTEKLVPPVQSASYIIDEDFEMRLVVEVYRVPDMSVNVGKGNLTARYELLVDRLMDPPQDALSLYVPDGTYKVLAWADYVLNGNGEDWHFDTSSLNSVKVNVEHKPESNHQKNSAAGLIGFSVDSNRGEESCLPLSEQTRDDQENGFIPVYMKRTAGRFRLCATDFKEFQESGYRIEELLIQIIYKQYVSAGYDVESQSPNAFVPIRTMEMRPGRVTSDGTVMLAYDYVLTSNEKEDHVLIDIVVYDAASQKEINYYQNIDVPLKRNQETVLYGPFLTQKVGSGVGIDDNFDGEHVVEIK